VAKKSAHVAEFTPGRKRKSLIEWNDPTRQAQILDWHHRAQDFGLEVEDHEEYAQSHPYEEPRKVLEHEEPEAFEEQRIPLRDDFERGR
jgi:hypothetical protein